MQKILITGVLIFISTIGYSQVTNVEGRPFRHIIKTNLLNLIMIPSIHYEQRIAKTSSLVINLHRGSLTLLTANNWLNSSLEYRKYFPKIGFDALKGKYFSLGIAHKKDYDNSHTDEFGNTTKFDNIKLGAIVRTGYQFGLSDEVSMDVGIGLAALVDISKKYRDPLEGEYRLMGGIGYRW
jgi:hypothetical protein